MPDQPTLQPGPLRDALALLSEHTRGGEGLTATKLAERTGLQYMTARRRLLSLAQRGFADKVEGLGGSWDYKITERGQAVLDA